MNWPESPSALGIPEEITCVPSSGTLSRLAASIGHQAEADDFDRVPLLWHWAVFTPRHPTSSLGPDGHPRLPEGAPIAVRLPRRMFAGGRVRQVGPLMRGRAATRVARVTETKSRTGRRGRLLVVRLGFEVHQDGVTVLHEEQDLIYRGAASSGSHATGVADRPTITRPTWTEAITLDRISLFRFSAATFNSHRIHYDEVYARDVEGYPGLVVQGPLTALLLAESAREHLGREITTFRFRARAPLFEGVPVSFRGRVVDGCAQMEAVRHDGALAMSASAT